MYYHLSSIENKGYQAIAKNLISKLDVAAKEFSLPEEKKEFDRLNFKAGDVLLVAGFRSDKILTAISKKRKTSGLKIIVLGPLSDDLRHPITQKERDLIDIVIDWEGMVLQEEINSKKTFFIKLDIPPFPFNSKRLGAFDHKVDDQVMLVIGTKDSKVPDTVTKVTVKEIKETIEKVLDFIQEKKLILSYNPRAMEKETSDGKNVVATVKEYLQKKNKDFEFVQDFQAYLQAMISSKYFIALEDTQAPFDACVISKLLKQEKNHYNITFDGRPKSLTLTFINNIIDQGFLYADLSTSVPNNLTNFIDPMDAILARIQKKLS